MTTQLIVFSDDWGRHPSSCQHLVKRLLPRYPTLWVNTIGTRLPGLSRGDLRKAAAKLRAWGGWNRGSRIADCGLRIEELRRAQGGENPQAVVGANVPPAALGQPMAMDNPRVISPWMYPGFRRSWQRGLNRRWIARAVHRALGPRPPVPPIPPIPPVPAVSSVPQEAGAGGRVVLTTLPITADLPGVLDADRWVYYCVDDFSVWPGADAEVMRDMEAALVGKADAFVAASEVLRDRLISLGAKDVTLLTHGIDLDHWTRAGSGIGSQESGVRGQESGIRSQESGIRSQASIPASPLASLRAGGGTGRSQESVVSRLQSEIRNSKSAIPPRPILLFWGLIDPRLDLAWCRVLAKECGTLVLVGPQQSPPPELAAMGAVMPGPVPYDDLPALAAFADVLVMPYADLPVTRAMQPLKFKEYLATGKPVVARDLPATRPWADAADLLANAADLAAVVKKRLAEGVPPSQGAARRRLADESWEKKAIVLEAVLR